MYDTIVSYREVTVSLQPYKQSDQGLHIWFDILSASFGCISIPYTISNKCIFIPFQYEVWSLEKRPFHNSSEELCKTQYWEEMGWR